MAHKVIDLHCDSVSSLMDGKDMRNSVPGVHVDIPRLVKGGVGLQVFAVYVPANIEKDKAFQFASERLDAIDAFAGSDERVAPVENAAEARSVIAVGKTGIMASVENGLAIENSTENLEALRRRKVRILTLVHSEHLPWVASCTGTGSFVSNNGNLSGLSSLGEKVIDAMNDLGIIPDLSHASEGAFWDVIRRSKKPVIASHSCAWNICNAARNLKDDQLKALRDTGGLVGVNFFAAFLSEAFRLNFEKDAKDSANLPPVCVPGIPMSIIADHIDYMVKLAGEDCVALGSDFDGIPYSPNNVTGSDFYPLLEVELRSRGYTEKRIGKIFNGNFLRVLEKWD